MSTTYPPSPLLRFLVGDAVLDMPASVVALLERTLETMQLDIASNIARADRWFSDMPAPLSVVIGRKMQSLGALLELLHAAHLDKGDGADTPLMADHLVEGVLIACRDIVLSAAVLLHERHPSPA